MTSPDAALGALQPIATTIVGALARAPELVIVATGAGAVCACNRKDRRFGHVADAYGSPPREEWEATLARVVATGAAETVEAALGEDAKAAWHQVGVSTVTAEGGAVVGVVLIGSDVTTRRRVEERLRTREALMVDTQGVAHLGTWEWDVTEPHAVWSDELFRIYDLDPATYVPSYEAYLTKVHPDDREHVARATERVFKEHVPYSHDERILRPDGSVRYLHTWAHPVLDEGGKLVKLVGVCQDITDRKAMELALRQAHKLEAVGRLAGGIAHDFNNLLGVVVGRSSLMMRGLAEDDPARASLEEITSVGRHAARLTQQLLTFSRDQPMSPEVVDLRRVVRDIAELLRRGIGEQVELETRFEEEALQVEADRGQLDQVVMNLVVNARDAMPHGGRILVEVLSSASAGAAPPDDLDPQGDYVVLVVSDTGVGMADDVMALIFDPYFTTKEFGNGLGLSTVYGIARKAGGGVTVTSTVGRGSRFHVFLPRVVADAASSGKAATGARGGRAARILLVEDQEELRHLFRLILTELGHEVTDAASGAEALTMAERGRAGFDLLMTDLVMPRMSGVELARRLREVLGVDLPVLLVSGWADEKALAAIDRGARFLQKPFTSEELGRAIELALAQSAPAESAAP